MRGRACVGVVAGCLRCGAARVRARTQTHPRTTPTNTDIDIRFVTRFGRVPLLLSALCATFMLLVLSLSPSLPFPPSLTPSGSLTCLF